MPVIVGFFKPSIDLQVSFQFQSPYIMQLFFLVEDNRELKRKTHLTNLVHLTIVNRIHVFSKVLWSIVHEVRGCNFWIGTAREQINLPFECNVQMT